LDVIRPKIQLEVSSKVIEISEKDMFASDTNSRKRRRVHFHAGTGDAGAVSNMYPPVVNDLVLETIVNLWYHKDEINAFKREVGSLLLKGNKRSVEEQDALCGLERHNYHRAMAKKQAVRKLVLSQKISRDPDFLQAVAARSSENARVVAFSQGFHDYCQAYFNFDANSDERNSVSKKPMMVPTSLEPSLVGTKRALRRRSIKAEGRRVRQRVVPSLE